MSIHCPHCGELIALPEARHRHDVLIQFARIRRSDTVRWSAIAGCNARLVGSGDSFEAAIVALDALADVAAGVPSSLECVSVVRSR